jgi:hypothetical protein
MRFSGELFFLLSAVLLTYQPAWAMDLFKGFLPKALTTIAQRDARMLVAGSVGGQDAFGNLSVLLCEFRIESVAARDPEVDVTIEQPGNASFSLAATCVAAMASNNHPSEPSLSGQEVKKVAAPRPLATACL